MRYVPFKLNSARAPVRLRESRIPNLSQTVLYVTT